MFGTFERSGRKEDLGNLWKFGIAPEKNPTKFIQTMLAIGSRFGMLHQAAPTGFAPAVPATNPLGWE